MNQKRHVSFLLLSVIVSVISVLLFVETIFFMLYKHGQFNRQNGAQTVYPLLDYEILGSLHRYPVFGPYKFKPFQAEEYVDEPVETENQEGIIIPKPNYVYRARKTHIKSFEEVLSYTFKTEGAGRRITALNDGRRTKHLIVFGCSYVFGQWLPDESTLPSVLQTLLSDADVYNAGFVGYSINDIYIRLKSLII